MLQHLHEFVLLGPVHVAYDVVDGSPQCLVRVPPHLADVRVQGLPEGESHVRVDPGQRGHLPGGAVVVVDHVLVAVGRVERLVLLGAEAEEDVTFRGGEGRGEQGEQNW